MIGQFADCLATTLGEAGETEPLAPAEPIDLVHIPAVRRYAGVALVALVVVWLVVRGLRRR
jgi:hypothetical protein